MPTYDAIADLPLTIEGYELERLEQSYGPEFTRVTTVIHLHGGGHEGIGEDVIYDTADHDAFQAAGPVLPLAGETTFDGFSKLLDEVDSFPSAPSRDASRDYRRWAFESAALDLALRQAGEPLHAVLGRPANPLTFVASTRLTGDPPTTEAVRKRRAVAPGVRFKLDPENDWTPELIAELKELDCVATCDLKGLYRGTIVDVETDPALYKAVAEAFPDAWLEDPDLNHAGAQAVLEPHMDRVTWDANLHSLSDVDRLAHPPKAINSKPSRFGPISRLFEVYDACAERGIAIYGGGQSELGCGRGQIQYLAAVFHPDTPNDVAPSDFNLPDPPADLPNSPLAPAPSQTGFRWG